MTTNPIKPDYLGAVEEDDIDRALQHISDALTKSDVSFLFGAGMSKPSGAPMAPELIARLLTMHFPSGGSDPIPDDRLKNLAWEFPFEAVVEAVQEGFPTKRRRLTEVLTELYLDPSLLPTQAHEDFVSIAFWGGRLSVNRIYTTNFDKLLEAAFGLDRTIAISESNIAEATRSANKGLLPIYHVHGLLDSEYTITESNVYSEDYRVLSSNVRASLTADDAFVFVGYSMSDPDFRRMYMNFRDDIKSRKHADKDTFFVSPPKDKYSYRLGKKIWDVRGATWIPLDAATFMARLKRFLETRTTTDIRAAVKKKYNLADEAALDDLIQRTGDTLLVDLSEALQFLHMALPKGGGK